MASEAAKTNSADEIPVGNGVHAVPGHRRKIEQTGDVTPVDGKPRSREGGRSQRHDIHPFQTVPEARLVAGEHLPKGQKIMGEKDRLRLLQVGISGQNHTAFLFRQIEETRLQRRDELQDPADLLPQVEPDIEGDLIVPAPPRVEFASHVADPLRQGLFDRHMDVLVVGTENKISRLDIGKDLAETCDDRPRLPFGNDPLPAQHPGMGDASLDVIAEEPPVEMKRRGECLHLTVRRLAESPPPGFFLCLHATP